MMTDQNSLKEWMDENDQRIDNVIGDLIILLQEGRKGWPKNDPYDEYERAGFDLVINILQMAIENLGGAVQTSKEFTKAVGEIERLRDQVEVGPQHE